jgi:hypothetical protein
LRTNCFFFSNVFSFDHLSFSYSFYSSYNWHLTGNTLVTDRFVRLTSDSQSKAGGLWNTIPVSYPDWEMHVHFKVHGTAKELFGDGFAIWYVRDPKLGGKYKDHFFLFKIKSHFL